MNDTPENLRRLDAQLLFLLERYPRESWASHANLGDLAQLWLQRHDMFRKLDRMIREGVETAFEERFEGPVLKRWLARYLQFYLGQLEGHHQVEDHHYFPAFRQAEPRLGRGFDILDADHDGLHRAIESIAAQANTFLRQPDADIAGLRTELGRFRDVHVAMGRDLILHLDDEEDLVVPLILDRGEDGLSEGG